MERRKGGREGREGKEGGRGGREKREEGEGERGGREEGGKKGNTPKSVKGHGTLVQLDKCLSSWCLLRMPHPSCPMGHVTLACGHWSSCSSLFPYFTRSLQLLGSSWNFCDAPPSTSSSPASLPDPTANPWQQCIRRSSICSITALFMTSWLESHSWSSMGHLAPPSIIFSMHLRQKVCPHRTDITGSRNTVLHTGQVRAGGSSTNLVGLSNFFVFPMLVILTIVRENRRGRCALSRKLWVWQWLT